MSPFLRGANPVFLKFIEDGLADIDRQQVHGNNGAGSSQFVPVNNPGKVLSDAGQAKKTPEYWEDRLVYWKVSVSVGDQKVYNYWNSWDQSVTSKLTNILI